MNGMGAPGDLGRMSIFKSVTVPRRPLWSLTCAVFVRKPMKTKNVTGGVQGTWTPMRVARVKVAV